MSQPGKLRHNIYSGIHLLESNQCKTKVQIKFISKKKKKQKVLLLFI